MATTFEGTDRVHKDVIEGFRAEFMASEINEPRKRQFNAMCDQALRATAVNHSAITFDGKYVYVGDQPVLRIHPGGEERAAQLISALTAKPFAWVRMLNGEIDWAEDCISGDPDHFDIPDEAREEGYSVAAVYLAAPSPEATPSQQPDNCGDSDRWQDPRDISGGETDCAPAVCDEPIMHMDMHGITLSHAAWLASSDRTKEWYSTPLVVQRNGPR